MDSGGPLFLTNYGIVYLVGIISFGKTCADNAPSVNTKVSEYVNWIVQNTPGASYCNR